jgi:hypothetical protein
MVGMSDGDDNIVDLTAKRSLREIRSAAGRKGAACAKETNNKPAKGKGTGIPAMGEGVGGPARPRGRLFSSDHQPTKPRRIYSPEELEALAQEGLEVMAEMMRTAESEYVRGVFAEKVRNQIVGTPVGRVITDRQAIALPGAVKAVFPKAVNGGD